MYFCHNSSQIKHCDQTIFFFFLIKVEIMNMRYNVSFVEVHLGICTSRKPEQITTNIEQSKCTKHLPIPKNVVYLELQHSTSISRLFMRTCRSTRKALARMSEDGLSRERIIFTTKSCKGNHSTELHLKNTAIWLEVSGHFILFDNNLTGDITNT